MVPVFVGHDWAEAHHDIHVEDGEGQRLAKARLPEGVEGVARPPGVRKARSVERLPLYRGVQPLTEPDVDSRSRGDP